MWTRLPKRLSSGLIETILRESNDGAETYRGRLLPSGKTFFDSRAELLSRILEELQDMVSGRVYQPIFESARLLYKGPHGGPMPIHQDHSYWLLREEVPAIRWTVWIALEPTTAENGALKIGRYPNASHLYLRHVEREMRDDNFALEIETEPDVVPLPMEQGEMVMFDSLEPHGSGTNRSAEMRRAMRVIYREGR